MPSAETRSVAEKSIFASEFSRLPFYRQPEVMSAARHGGLKLKSAMDFSFAREANAVAITATEFAQAMRYYPIVFSGATIHPAAVLGLRAKNLFVDADGHWRRGHYVPAYLRRYPFVFMTPPEGNAFILGIDRACDGLAGDDAPPDAKPLYDGDKPGAVTESALKFCSAYQADFAYTKAFTQALADRDLLIDNQAQAKLAGGNHIHLTGFKIVDRKKFATLPPEVAAEWHGKGWLAPVYFHLASLDRFAALLDLHGAAPS